MISAKILLDSINSDTGDRITSFLLTYPRFIHAEFMTHRALSRNASSSRAIPIMKMLRSILANPAAPVSWGKNGKGMQSKEALPVYRQKVAQLLVLVHCWVSCGFSWLLHKIGVHKQIANRYTEPWAHITTLATATEWQNFFALRCHPDAQPEFQELAFQMLAAYLDSKPVSRKPGEWHCPFAEMIDAFPELEQQLKISTARCARTSYLNFDGSIDPAKDFTLHDDLKSSGHMSPFDHSARALSKQEKQDDFESGREKQANLRGYAPYRKSIPNENRSLTREDMVMLLYEHQERKHATQK